MTLQKISLSLLQQVLLCERFLNPLEMTDFPYVTVLFYFLRYHHTPAINLIYALRESLSMISEEVC